MFYPNMFRNTYRKLEGKDWIRGVSEEDRRVFITIGLRHAQWGKLGGIARARTGTRDKRGRFVSTLDKRDET
jgi:hypothetical protein